MTRSETYSLYKSALVSEAYRILGEVADVEDVVQDTFVSWLSIPAESIQFPRAYLLKAVRNKSISRLQHLRRGRDEQAEQYPGSEDISQKRQLIFEQQYPLKVGIRILLEKLSTDERAVFLLKEIFSYAYNEIAKAIGKPPDHCRQIFKRAQERLQAGKKRFVVSEEISEKFFDRFMEACRHGNLRGLIALLQQNTPSRDATSPRWPTAKTTALEPASSLLSLHDRRCNCSEQ